MMKHKTGFRKIFLRDMFRFFIFSFIPLLLLAVLISQYAFRLVVEEINLAAADRLQQLQTTIDKDIGNINTDLLFLSDIKLSTQNRRLRSENIVQYHYLIEELRGIKIANELTESAWVYNEATNRIIDDSGVNVATDFFKKSYRYEAFSSEEILKTIDESTGISFFGPHKTVSIGINGKINGEKRVILLLVNSVYNRDNSLRFGAIIHDKSLSKRMAELISNGSVGQTFLMVEPQQNQFIFRDSMENQEELERYVMESLFLDPTEDKTTLQDEKYSILSTKSEISGWHYVSLLPLESINSRLRSITMLTVWLCGALAILSILVSYVLSRMSNRKLDILVDTVRDNVKKVKRKSSEEELFINTILNERYVEKYQMLSDLQPMVEESFFVNMLSGRLPNADQSARKLREYGFLTTENNAFVVMVSEAVPTPSLHNMTVDWDMVKTQIQVLMSALLEPELNEFSAKYAGYYVQIVEVADLELLQQKLEQITTILAQDRQYYHVFIALGSTVSTIDEVSESFREATHLMSQRVYSTASSHLTKDSLRTEEKISDYITDQELQRMIDFLLQGEAHKVQEAVSAVFDRAWNKGISLPMLQEILLRILSGYDEFIEYYSTEKEYLKQKEQLLSTKSMEEMQSILQHMSAEIVGSIYQQDNTAKTVDEIKEIIEDQYRNPDLGLVLVSQQVGLSPKYISQIFKEESNHNFLDYVNSVRFSHADYWLETTELRIFDIAEKVGFRSSNAFIKSYKKYKKMTPGQYRQLKNNDSKEKNRSDDL